MATRLFSWFSLVAAEALSFVAESSEGPDGERSLEEGFAEFVLLLAGPTTLALLSSVGEEKLGPVFN